MPLRFTAGAWTRLNSCHGIHFSFPFFTVTLRKFPNNSRKSRLILFSVARLRYFVRCILLRNFLAFAAH